LKFRRELLNIKYYKSAEGARFKRTETLRLKNSEGTELWTFEQRRLACPVSSVYS